MAVQFNNFSFQYAGSTSETLKSINLNIKEGCINVICGASSCGKTTLLKNIKKEIAPVGKVTGEMQLKYDSSEIGIVFQNPDIQLVTGDTLHDLAFPMENLGLDNLTMHKRMAEMTGFFGLSTILHSNSEELSGGQKQMIALCSVLMTHPKLLLLDEPISQLDPISAQKLIGILQRLRDEQGITIVITEHRLDDIIKVADFISLMDKGEMIYTGDKEQFCRSVYATAYERFVPSIPRLCAVLGKDVVFVPNGLKKQLPLLNRTRVRHTIMDNKILTIKNLYYAYPNSEYILTNLNLTVHKGEKLCLMGSNGGGKTTLLKCIAGICKNAKGTIKVNGRIAYMPQNPNTYFIHDTVREEVEGVSEEILNKLSISHLLDRHPYDISYGEAQKVVLASILKEKCDILLLDEPTKGLDPYSKMAVIEVIKQSGATVICSTHDTEFAAYFAHYCAFVFDGEVTQKATPFQFFTENRYYTTEVNKACDTAIIAEEVLEQCGKII